MLETVVEGITTQRVRTSNHREANSECFACQGKKILRIENRTLKNNYMHYKCLLSTTAKLPVQVILIYFSIHILSLYSNLKAIGKLS